MERVVRRLVVFALREEVDAAVAEQVAGEVGGDTEGVEALCRGRRPDIGLAGGQRQRGGDCRGRDSGLCGPARLLLLLVHGGDGLAALLLDRDGHAQLELARVVGDGDAGPGEDVGADDGLVAGGGLQVPGHRGGQAGAEHGDKAVDVDRDIPIRRRRHRHVTQIDALEDERERQIVRLHRLRQPQRRRRLRRIGGEGEECGEDGEEEGAQNKN